ncbi:MAG: AGE family epimerase/isomerase, partial [Robiginitomaculum sp.]|nr:AGE family epimerase/isomerase [Robiginitomaculum sp.]
KLHFDGTPDEQVARRLRVTSRQIYAFSQASVLGWMDARALVNWAVDYLVSKPRYGNNGPGFVHLLHPDGTVCDARRDLYDHAFHILALSWAWRATKDSQILALAQETLDFVDEAMGAEGGGWQEGLPAQLPRHQNSHMHMFEALLALYEASGDAGILKRLDGTAALLAERFIDPKTGTLFEDFHADLTPIHPAKVEPGHMAEWCWLLHKRAAIQHAAPDELAKMMGQNADAYAPKGRGFLLDAFDEDGNILRFTRRLWGQTEWLKSMLVRYDAGDANMRAQAGALLRRLQSSYFDTTLAGLWIDQFDLDGNPVSEHVPASIVYHLVSAAAEAQSVLDNRKDVVP